MNTLRCFLFAIVVISSSTLALGGDMQAPGKSEPPPPASSTEPTTDRITASTSTEEIQIAWQDLSILLLRDILLSIY